MTNVTNEKVLDYKNVKEKERAERVKKHRKKRK